MGVHRWMGRRARPFPCWNALLVSAGPRFWGVAFCSACTFEGPNRRPRSQSLECSDASAASSLLRPEPPNPQCPQPPIPTFQPFSPIQKCLHTHSYVPRPTCPECDEPEPRDADQRLRSDCPGAPRMLNGQRGRCGLFCLAC